MRERARPRTGLDDRRPGPDVQMLRDEGDVRHVEDLRPVRQRERPELRRRSEQVREALAVHRPNLGPVGEADHVRVLEGAELGPKLASTVDRDRVDIVASLSTGFRPRPGAQCRAVRGRGSPCRPLRPVRSNWQTFWRGRAGARASVESQRRPGPLRARPPPDEGMQKILRAYNLRIATEVLEGAANVHVLPRGHRKIAVGAGLVKVDVAGGEVDARRELATSRAAPCRDTQAEHEYSETHRLVHEVQ